MASRPLTVYIYQRDLELLKEVQSWLKGIQEDFDLVVVVMEQGKDAPGQRFDSPLVVRVGVYTLNYPFGKTDLSVAVTSASQQQEHRDEIVNRGYQKKVKQGAKITTNDKIANWLANHYMALINTLLVLYVGLPFLAPIFMKIGAELPAKIIYTIYRPLCHQFAFRSFFLFGEQIVYPRELAGIPRLITYEDVTHTSADDFMTARYYTGDQTVGYKVALCERDIAIWGSLTIFGVLFSLMREKIKSLPWWIWAIIGVIPLGLDGISQLTGIPGAIAVWLPARESTPMIRMVTGILFGVTTGWYVFPLMEETMRESRAFIRQKIRTIELTRKAE